MLLSRFKYYTGFLILTDSLGIVVAYAGTYALRNSLLPAVSALPPLLPWDQYLPLLIFIIPVWVSLLLWFDGYVFSVEKSYWRWALQLALKTTAGGLLALGAYLFISKSTHISRTFLLLCALTNGLVVFSVRALFYAFIRSLGKTASLSRNLLVVGTRRASQRVLQSIKDHARWGLTLQEFVEIEELDEDSPAAASQGALTEAVKAIEALFKSVVVDEVVICLPKSQILQFEPLNQLCSESGVRVNLFCDLFPTHNPHIQVSTFYGLGMITIDPTMGRELRYFLKRVIDMGLASLLLAALSPLMLAVSVAIKLTSRGPVLFRQTRVGLNGRHFQMYKFRTMVEGAEAMRGRIERLNVLDGPVFKAMHDPRLTPIGRFLRRAFIDEIPQLLNVIKGEMSLVGPRPPIPSEVQRYKLWHSKRLNMKPGITGLWQVSGRSKFVSFEEWMWMDLEYIERWSLWLDFKILFKTVPEVLRLTGV